MITCKSRQIINNTNYRSQASQGDENWPAGSFLFHGWIYVIIRTVPTSSAVYGWLVSDFVIIFYFVQKGGRRTFRHIGDKWVRRLMASVVLHVFTDIHFTSIFYAYNCSVTQCPVHSAVCTLDAIYTKKYKLHRYYR